MKASKRNQYAFLISLLIAVVSYIAMFEMVGANKWISSTAGYRSMICECSILFFVFLLLWWRLQPRKALACTATVIIGFCYVHVLLLPFLVAGAYFLSIWAIGRFIAKRLIGADHPHIGILSVFFGAGASILITAVLSAFKQGSIEKVRLAWFTLTLLYLLSLVAFEKKEESKNCFQFSSERFSAGRAAILAGIIALCLMVLGRSNGGMDYDSLWYGLQPQYVLSGKEGIFEDQGLLAVVYWFPKLYEILLLPISGFSSYAYLIVANVMIGFAELYMVYRVARLYVDHDRALLMVLLVGSVPAIAVMFLSVKTDVITLLLQTVMIYFCACEMKGVGINNIAGMFAFWLVSLGCKTTSTFFSTAILAVGLCLIAIGKAKGKIPRLAHSRHTAFIIVSIGVLLLSIAMLRSYLITGIPMNSLLLGLFKKLGFSLKAPYGGGGVQTYPISYFFTKEGFFNAVQRIILFFFWPATLSHVGIAWGGPLVAALCIVALVALFNRRVWRDSFDDYSKLFLIISFLAILIISLGCISLLSQVDGNYFLLMYVLSVFMLLALEQETINRFSAVCLIPMIIFGVLYAGVSGWASDHGFRCTEWVNNGYYSHEAQALTRLEEKMPAIMSELKTHPDARLVTIRMSHADVCEMPFNAEDTELINAWGNSGVLQSPEAFAEYLRLTKRDYVLIYIDEETVSTSMFTTIEALVDDGYLLPTVSDEAYILLSVQEMPLQAEERISLRSFISNVML